MGIRGATLPSSGTRSLSREPRAVASLRAKWGVPGGRERGPPSNPPTAPRCRTPAGRGPGRLQRRVAGQSAGSRCPVGRARAATALDAGGRHVWAGLEGKRPPRKGQEHQANGPGEATGPGALGLWPGRALGRVTLALAAGSLCGPAWGGGRRGAWTPCLRPAGAVGGVLPLGGGQSRDPAVPGFHSEDQVWGPATHCPGALSRSGGAWGWGGGGCPEMWRWLPGAAESRRDVPTMG